MFCVGIRDEQHLAVIGSDVLAKQVPPVELEVLAFVDEDRVVGSLKALLERPARFGDRDIEPRRAPGTRTSRPVCLGVVRHPAAEAVALWVHDTRVRGLRRSVSAVDGHERLQVLGQRDVVRDHENVLSLCGEAGGRAARPYDLPHPADPRIRRILALFGEGLDGLRAPGLRRR